MGTYQTTSFSPPGHINHRDGFAVTRNGTTDIAYILHTKLSSTGTQLFINTQYKKSNGSWQDSKTLYPIIPYRLPFADMNYLNKLTASDLADQDLGAGAGNVLLFNPGLTSTTIFSRSQTLLNETAIQSPFVELNVTRDNITKLVANTFGHIYKFQYRTDYAGVPSDQSIISITSPTIRADDVRASIIAVNKSATVDELYISVTTRIVITGGMGTIKLSQTSPKPLWTRIEPASGVNPPSKTYTYTVPVLLKLEIDRSGTTPILTSSSTGKIRPSDWRYLFPISDLEKIRSAESGAFDADSLNFKVIPYIRRNTSTTLYESTIINHGCIWDTVSDGTKLWVMCAVTKEATGYIIQRLTCTNYILSSFLGGTSFWNSESAIIMPGVNGNDRLHISNLYGAYNDGKILFASSVIEFDKKKTPTTSYWTQFYFFDNTSSRIVSSVIYSDLTRTYVVPYKTSFCLTACNVLSGGSSVNIIRTPTLVQLASLNSTTKKNITSMTVDGFSTLFTKSNLISYIDSTSTVMAYPEALSIWEETKIYFNTWGDDKSLLLDPFHNGKTNTVVLSVINDSILEITYCRFDINTSVLYIWESSDFESGVTSFSNTLQGICSINDDGVNANTYFRLSANTSNLIVTAYDVANIDASNAIGSIGYWGNENFALDINGNGVRVILILDPVSGIYKAGYAPPVAEDWNDSLGGILVDPSKLRPDIILSYGGIKDLYIANPVTNANYWATLQSPTSNLSLKYRGQELLYGGNGENVNFCSYNYSGVCNIQMWCTLDLDDGAVGGGPILDGAGRSYTDPGYSLEDVEYSLIINTPDPITVRGLLDITPPSPSGYIDTTIYTTALSSVNFTAFQDSKTDLVDIYVYKNEQPVNHLDSKLATDNNITTTISASTANFLKGDYLSIRYKPLYSHSRGPDSLLSSRKVTITKGHKYWIENPVITVDGIDKTSEIAASSSPWLYISPAAANIPISIKVDIKHENFSNLAYPNELDKVYPLIYSTYMVILPAIYFDPAGKEVPSAGYSYAPTYPNCSYAVANRLLVEWSNAPSAYKATNLHGTVIELTNEILTAQVEADGNYQVYLLVEDMDGQISAWCLTNLMTNLRIPFATNGIKV